MDPMPEIKERKTDVHQTHLAAKSSEATQNPRLSRTHGDAHRARSAAPATPERARPVDGPIDDAKVRLALDCLRAMAVSWVA